jgi:hypothetical protein
LTCNYFCGIILANRKDKPQFLPHLKEGVSLQKIMKQIKPVGTIKQEPKVNRKERSSLAYKMTVDGTNSRQEFIDMIDSKAKSGKAKDKLAEAIKIAIASKATNKKYTLEFLDLLDGFRKALAKVSECSGYETLCQLRKKILNSFVDSALSFKEQYHGKKKPVLTARQEKEFKLIMKDVNQNWKEERDRVTMENIDGTLNVIRDELITSMGVNRHNVEPIGLPVNLEAHMCNCGGSCKNGNT